MLKTKALSLALAAMAVMTTAAFADPDKANNGNKPDHAGQQYELVDGSSFDNAGEMFQHLRDRDNGYAAGNPKDIVEAYPNEFDNVGDLIRQKRVN